MSTCGYSKPIWPLINDRLRPVPGGLARAISGARAWLLILRVPGHAPASASPTHQVVMCGAQKSLNRSVPTVDVRTYVLRHDVHGYVCTKEVRSVPSCDVWGSGVIHQEHWLLAREVPNPGLVQLGRQQLMAVHLLLQGLRWRVVIETGACQ
eukprot:1158864-Pelagomonas_calceolata.AAC.5